MYQIGDCVVYGVHGVCRVIGMEKQLVNRKRSLYMVLQPLAQTESRFYLPTENPTAMAKLKTVMTKEALVELLASDQVRQEEWIPDENRRKQYYRELIGSGDRVSLMRMITNLYRYSRPSWMPGGNSISRMIISCATRKDSCLRKYLWLWIFPWRRPEIICAIN